MPISYRTKRTKERKEYNTQEKSSIYNHPMSYFSRGHVAGGDDDVDDFDEYDPTPYGGGYDIILTYGRPLPPSEETCYPNTSSVSEDFDYDRPQYTSYAEPSAYSSDALDNEYKSYVRPKPRPASRPSYEAPSEEGGYGYEKPSPNYGFQPGMNRPSGGYGGESEYGGGEGTGSGYGRKPEYGSGYDNPTSEYGGRTEYEKPSSEYGSGYQKPSSGYGRKSEYEEPSSEYGSGYGRKSEYEAPESGYGRKSEYEEPSSEYGRKSSGYGSGRKSEYEEPSSEYGSGYGHKTESEEYGSGYGRKPSYGEEVDKGAYGYGGKSERPSYGQSYETPREGFGGSSYERPSYGRSEEEDYKKPSYGRREDEEEGYGRKKYVRSLTLHLSLFSFTLKRCLLS